MVYFPNDGSDTQSAAQNWPRERDTSFYTAIRALNASTGDIAWEYRRKPRRVDNDIGGVLSTAGDVVFGGDQTTLFALDSQTGKLLWSFECGGKIAGAPITYRADGTQYVAVAAGSALLVFSDRGAGQNTAWQR